MTETSPSQAFFDLSATYDRAVNRWLPVAAGAVSPDGLRFAFADYDLPPGGASASTGRVHVIDAQTGSDHIVFSGSPTFSVVAFSSRGLYLSQVDLANFGVSARGLFVLDPAGGTPHPVAGADRTLDQHGWRIEGPNAWGVDFASGGGLISGNRVLSLDLETGAVRVWKTWAEGVLAVVLGVDAEHEPIVGAFQSSSSTNAGTPPGLKGIQVWTFSSPDARTLLYETTDPVATLPGRPAISDTNATWLGGNSPPSSVWRLASGRMVRVPVQVAGSGWVGVGGGCV